MPAEQNVGQTCLIVTGSATDFDETLCCIECTRCVVIGKAPEIEPLAPGLGPIQEALTNAPAAQVGINIELLNPTRSPHQEGRYTPVEPRSGQLSQNDMLAQECAILVARMEDGQ